MFDEFTDECSALGRLRFIDVPDEMMVLVGLNALHQVLLESKLLPSSHPLVEQAKGAGQRMVDATLQSELPAGQQWCAPPTSVHL